MLHTHPVEDAFNIVVLNMAKEKKEESPQNCNTAFTEKLKTRHRLCVCTYTYHVSYTLALFSKKKSLKVFAVIFGAFFSRDNSA